MGVPSTAIAFQKGVLMPSSCAVARNDPVRVLHLPFQRNKLLGHVADVNIRLGLEGMYYAEIALHVQAV